MTQAEERAQKAAEAEKAYFAGELADNDVPQDFTLGQSKLTTFKVNEAYNNLGKEEMEEQVCPEEQAHLGLA